MKKFRNLPAIFTLAAGFVACVVMIVQDYVLKDFLLILLCVMAGFYLVGTLVRVLLDKIYRKEEEKRELQRQQEEREKEEAENAEKVNEENT